MPDATLRLQPNEAEVAAKVMDGEAILINITSGMYHSTDGVGAFAWERLAAGRTIGEIVEDVCRRYDVEPDCAAADLDTFFEGLLAESLVTASNEPAPTAPAWEDGPRSPYASPTLNSYRDMSDLLALDPPMPGLQQAPWSNDADAA